MNKSIFLLMPAAMLMFPHMLSGQTNPESPELKSYSKFDFVPGDKVIFFDDFTQDNAGDFPAK